MSIIHGSWIVQSNQNYFFVWAEAWRSLVNVDIAQNVEGDRIHPFALTQAELLALLSEQDLASAIVLNADEMAASWQEQFVEIPSLQQGEEDNQRLIPLFTGENIESDGTYILYDWLTNGFCLSASAAIEFLQIVSLRSLQADATYIGGDLRFWCHIYRWSLDLIVRQKYVPGIIHQSSAVISIWQHLIDSEQDRVRLAKFTQAIPPICLAYLDIQQEDEQRQAQELILRSLAIMLDGRLRSWIDYNPSLSKDVTVQLWLQTLSEFSSQLELEKKSIQRLENALYNWTLPIQEYLVDSNNNYRGQNQYRACFWLQPPARESPDAAQGDWQLQYYLQALDEPEFRVAAATIWQCNTDTLPINGRIINQPQESLLKGLGLATRIYSPITESLEQSQPRGCQLDPIQVYEFIRSVAWQLQNNGLGVILPPGLASGDNEQRLGIKITAEVARKKGERLSLQSLLKYKLEIAVGDRTISQKDFKRLLGQKSPIVEVGGQWLALQPADVKAAQAVLDRSNEEMELSVEDALRLSTGDTKVLAKLPVVQFAPNGVLAGLINNLTDNKTVEPITEIAGFEGQLRSYQAKGVGWLSFLETWGLGACLADDMGLGKTIELIAFLLNLKQQDNLVKPSLLVCPTSVINNWEREVRKFAPDLNILIHHGEKRSQGKALVKQVKDKQLVITSYSLVHRDLKSLAAIDWQNVVLDEAQNIKNPSAKQSQAVREIEADFRVALTGTPVENRLSELWSILDFLNPGFLGTPSFFQKRFATPIEKYGDRDSLNILRSLVQPFILRRLKTDENIIQDLPEKQEMNVFCGLSAEQAELYEELVNQSLTEIEDSEGIKQKGLILTLLMRLKQLCNHPELIKSESKSKQKKAKIDLENFSQRSGKLLRLEEMLEETISEGDRSLIFTQFAEWGKMLQPYLEAKLGSEVLFLYGSTRRQARQEMIDRFQHEPDGPRIFILSLKAGGTGLNLTRANHVFHVDRWWNPAVENQATDRAFRIGQKRNVQVHKFVCTGTLEEKINDIIESKKELAEQTVNAGETWLTKLDTDKLRRLLLLDRDRLG